MLIGGHHQGYEKPPKPTVSIAKRVNRFEMCVRDGQTDDDRLLDLLKPIGTQVGYMLVNALPHAHRRGRVKCRVFDTLPPDPDNARS